MTTLPDVAFAEAPLCPCCGAEKAWIACAVCSGDGQVSADAYNKFTYDEDFADCKACGGEGGWWHCKKCNE